MKNFSLMKIISMLSVSVLALVSTGCSNVRSLTKNLDNHSLTYTKAQKLAPVQIPTEIQTQPFTPLYTVPQAGENTIKIKNEKGKRFVLPKPYSTIK